MDLSACQECTELGKNLPEDSGLDALAKNLDCRGIVGTVDRAPHDALRFMFSEQARPVRCFNKWAGVNLVIRPDERWDLD